MLLNISIMSLISAMYASLARTAPASPYARLQPQAKKDHGRTRSRYMPHQGERECARRRRQMLKAHGKNPVARFYGSLSGGDVV